VRTKDNRNREDRSPYGPGFIAAAIVIGAVLMCGVLLIGIGAFGGGDTSAAAGRGPEVEQPSGRADPEASAKPGDRCGLPAGDQAVPDAPPVGVSWQVYRRMVVPASPVHGPARTDPDGYRRCFAHSPTGAVLAAYNAVAALGDDRLAAATAAKAFLPGPDTDRFVREVATAGPEVEDSPNQLAGFKVLDAGRDRVSVMLAFAVGESYVSGNLTMVWYPPAGDWRVLPPRPGVGFGAPYAEHTGLSDFVRWSGV